MEQNIQGNAETGASDASYNDGASDLLWLELLSGDVLEDGNDQLYTGETEKSARLIWMSAGCFWTAQDSTNRVLSVLNWIPRNILFPPRQLSKNWKIHVKKTSQLIIHTSHLHYLRDGSLFSTAVEEPFTFTKQVELVRGQDLTQLVHPTLFGSIVFLCMQSHVWKSGCLKKKSADLPKNGMMMLEGKRSSHKVRTTKSKGVSAIEVARRRFV
eukprot:Em0011g504a